MDKIVDYLKQLDLSDAEAKLYLTLLQTGPTSVRDLAQTVDIKRTTAYFYIDQLVEKGLIMKLVRGAKKLVAANEPENLKILVEEKLKKANEVQKGFPDIIKSLKTSLPESQNNGDPEIRYFKNKNSARKIYEEALKSSEVRLYANISELAILLPNELNIFEEALKHNSNLKIYELIADTPREVKHIDLPSQTGRYFYKFIPSHIGLTSACILMYDDNVAILNVRENMSGVILHNKDYFINSTRLFDFIWSILPDKDN